jgi:endonuclease YncB( thermonuclease family)
MPWVFVLGIAAGTMLPLRQWAPWLPGRSVPQEWQETEELWRRAGNPVARHPVDVIRTIDGDTFEAQVHLWPGLDLHTRVRLRGVDAPERKAACAEEARMAEAASVALRALLDEGEVTISNVGPDKYQGRVVADASTKRTPSIATALLKSGHARSYTGGHRNGWCG